MTGAEQRSFFFSTPAKILSECRCSRNVYKGGGKAELTFFSLHCVCEAPYVCLFMYLCMCFLKTPDWFHACFGCTAEEHTQRFVLAPLCRFAVVENWSKSK